MKILHTEWSKGWGGQEQRTVLESTLMRERGHEVLLAAPNEAQIYARAQQAGVTVHDMALRGAGDVRSIFSLRRLIRREGINLVVTHSSRDSWCAAIATRGLSNVGLVRMRHLSVLPTKGMVHRVYSIPDLVITTAQQIADILIDRCAVDPERVISVPTGVDLNRFDRTICGDEVKRSLGLEPGIKLIMYVAVLRTWKRHDIALKAFRKVLARCPSARLVLVGEGPIRDNVTSLIESLGLEDHVIMTGHREDVPNLIAAADLGILSSDNGEGVPQAVLQFMAMHTPVVGTRIGGVPELIRNGETGWLVEPRDIDGLVDAMVEGLTCPRHAAAYADAAYQDVCEHWTTEKMTDRLEELYAGVLAGSACV